MTLINIVGKLFLFSSKPFALNNQMLAATIKGGGGGVVQSGERGVITSVTPTGCHSVVDSKHQSKY